MRYKHHAQERKAYRLMNAGLRLLEGVRQSKPRGTARKKGATMAPISCIQCAIGRAKRWRMDDLRRCCESLTNERAAGANGGEGGVL